MDWMTEKNPVFDLVISQETIFQALSNYSQNQTLKNFCQFNFIQRIYGLAGPPQQLEFVTVPPATQRFIFLIPFFYASQCLKIGKKVASNIASEASYIFD